MNHQTHTALYQWAIIAGLAFTLLWIWDLLPVNAQSSSNNSVIWTDDRGAKFVEIINCKIDGKTRAIQFGLRNDNVVVWRDDPKPW